MAVYEFEYIGGVIADTPGLPPPPSIVCEKSFEASDIAATVAGIQRAKAMQTVKAIRIKKHVDGHERVVAALNLRR